MVTMTDAQAMLTVYAENTAPVSRTKNVSAVKKFLAFSAGDFGRGQVLAYIHYLEQKRYSPNTIRRHDLVAIRRFFRVNNIPWPLRSWELPKVTEDDVFAPALAAGVVRKMIRAGRDGRILRDDAALLALSTTFGLRRVELAALTAEHVRLEERRLYVETAKAGRSRWHLIPEELVPWLTGLPLRHPWSPRQVSKSYLRIEQAAGLNRMEEVGWHAIRRAVVRGLIEVDLPESTIRQFLRWRRGGSDMLLMYANTTVVAEGGVTHDPGRGDRETDERVFAVHPFLKEWR